jgi:hypothetical protein
VNGTLSGYNGTLNANKGPLGAIKGTLNGGSEGALATDAITGGVAARVLD